MRRILDLLNDCPSHSFYKITSSNGGTSCFLLLATSFALFAGFEPEGTHDRAAVSTAAPQLAPDSEQSIDLATLVFVGSILASRGNAELQSIFNTELERQAERPTSGLFAGPTHPTVLFVPGFLYRSHPETGGDFAAQRLLLSELGIPNHLIATDEAGSVEANARRIATLLRQRRDEHIYLVSASKGGPEVAVALGRLLAPEETRSIALWINIGGLLGGSPLADLALRPSHAWFTRIALWWKQLEIDGVRSLRTAHSRQRLADLRLPPDLPVVNLVPVPLSSDFSKRGAGGYRKLRRFGPNDGMALLADQILPASRTLLLIGDDHFLTRQDPRELTLALLQTAHQDLQGRAENHNSGDLAQVAISTLTESTARSTDTSPAALGAPGPTHNGEHHD